MTNRVAVTKQLTLRSVNGPAVTVIEGYQVPGTTNGDGAIRCVYLTNGAVLSGFTLTKGATRISGDDVERSGGGVWCMSTRAVVTNCILTANWAYAYGGGAYSGTMDNCTFNANSTSYHGGGACHGTLRNCKLTSNSAMYGGGAWGGRLNNCTLTGNSAAGLYGIGGGAYYSTLNDCTITDNSASYHGGGADSSRLNNCILYYNKAESGLNDSFVALSYCCTTSAPADGIGNITNAPLFVDRLNGNLRLQSNSPCINAGNHAYVSSITDLDGNPRIVGGTVDIGAYEFQTPTSLLSYAWARQYGLPTDGSADFTDNDADTLNNWQEWRAGTIPTNALSVLRLLTPASDGTNLTVTWESVAGRNYFLESSPDLSSTSAFTRLATDIWGQTNTTSYVDTNAVGVSPRFYRVGVE
jgi:hypothetical protein